jgi:hypothetical protein
VSDKLLAEERKKERGRRNGTNTICLPNELPVKTIQESKLFMEAMVYWKFYHG